MKESICLPRSFDEINHLRYARQSNFDLIRYHVYQQFQEKQTINHHFE